MRGHFGRMAVGSRAYGHLTTWISCGPLESQLWPSRKGSPDHSAIGPIFLVRSGRSSLAAGRLKSLQRSWKLTGGGKATFLLGVYGRPLSTFSWKLSARCHGTRQGIPARKKSFFQLHSHSCWRKSELPKIDRNPYSPERPHSQGKLP